MVYFNFFFWYAFHFCEKAYHMWALSCKPFLPCGSHLHKSISLGKTSDDILGGTSVQAQAKLPLLDACLCFFPKSQNANANLHLYSYIWPRFEVLSVLESNLYSLWAICPLCIWSYGFPLFLSYGDVSFVMCLFLTDIHSCLYVQLSRTLWGLPRIDSPPMSSAWLCL